LSTEYLRPHYATCVLIMQFAIYPPIFRPPSLTHSLAHSHSWTLHGAMLRRTPFFRSCNHSFLAALADELTTHVFMPDDAVFYKGDASTDLYFVLSGTFRRKRKYRNKNIALHPTRSFVCGGRMRLISVDHEWGEYFFKCRSKCLAGRQTSYYSSRMTKVFCSMLRKM
jgi:hypothetical protein